jgi:hypothetical protein
MEREISYGGILCHTLALVAGDSAVALSLVAVFTAIATAVDVSGAPIGNFLGLPVMVVQYFILRRLVDRQGLRAPTTGYAGFGSFFALGLVSGFAILLASILFILPGIYLSARWAMSDAVLLAEDGTVGSALQRSGTATKGHTLPIALALVTLMLPSFAVLALTILPAMWPGVVPDPGLGQAATISASLALNLGIYLPQVVGWYFGIALYEMTIGRPGDRLSEVFA